MYPTNSTNGANEAEAADNRDQHANYDTPIVDRKMALKIILDGATIKRPTPFPLSGGDGAEDGMKREFSGEARGIDG